jgi:hypothetical protein
MNKFKLGKTRADLANNLWFALNVVQVHHLLILEYAKGSFEHDSFADDLVIESKIRFVVEKHLKQRGFKIDPDRKWTYDGDISEYIPSFNIRDMYPPTMHRYGLDSYMERDDIHFVRFPIKKYI